MEDPTIPELLLEVTTIEDLVDVSRRSDQYDRQAQALEITAKGFRNLVAEPDLYSVNYADYESWTTKLETSFDEARKARRNSDGPISSVGALSSVLLSNVNLDVPDYEEQLYGQLERTFELRNNQRQAFKAAKRKLESSSR